MYQLLIAKLIIYFPQRSYTEHGSIMQQMHKPRYGLLFIYTQICADSTQHVQAKKPVKSKPTENKRHAQVFPSERFLSMPPLILVLYLRACTINSNSLFNWNAAIWACSFTFLSIVVVTTCTDHLMSAGKKNNRHFIFHAKHAVPIVVYHLLWVIFQLIKFLQQPCNGVSPRIYTIRVFCP